MSLYRKIKPPRPWQPYVAAVLGAIAALSIYLANTANVTSYLTDDPRACINCHVMTTEYITWKNSSHREVATCNDCHVPQDNVIKKYAFKAKDGLYHASIYTTRTEPQAIIMHEAGQEVVQSNCIRCHTDQVTDAKLSGWITTHDQDRTERTCWECHREIPHGRVKSLTATGYHLEPLSIEEEQQLLVPEWLEKATNQTKKAHE